MVTKKRKKRVRIQARKCWVRMARGEKMIARVWCGGGVGAAAAAAAAAAAICCEDKYRCCGVYSPSLVASACLMTSAFIVEEACSVDVPLFIIMA